MHGYRADRAFDGDRLLTGGALVLVDAGRIVGVQDGAAPAPPGCPVTHLPGTTLLPGLIDAHTHLCGNDAMDALERLPHVGDDEIDAAVTKAFDRHLQAGVTAVRDLGDHRWAVVDRHRDRADGPTVVAAGPPITSVGGHCADLGGAVAGIPALRAAVRERVERGADLVKLMTSGGVMTPGTDVRACQFTLEEVRAVVDEAHRHGLPVTAHAHALAAVEQCVAAGVDGIEHCTCVGPHGVGAPPALADAIAAAGIAVCPTLGHDMGRMPPLPPAAAEAVARSGLTRDNLIARAGALHRRGVTLISGADSGINPVKAHGNLPLAVIELVEGGVSTVDALASATGRAADACGLAGRTGRLRAGLDADLLLVEGDPTTDILALRTIRTVVSRGRIFYGTPVA
jgi:imidazolonepropionase-like amidohydrolase